MKKTNWFLLVLMLTLTFGQTAFANDNLPDKGIFDLWNYQEVIDVKLTFDLDEVFNDRRGEEDYPAEINFKDETGTKQDWQIKISTRGNFRRQKCNETPPLKLNFKKGDLRAAGLADFDDFKLVTHCIDDYQAAKELLLKEYLTYRMFNQLTDISYRVQLVNITYEDSQTGKRKKQMGFLIEDTAQLRARIGADKIEELRIVEQEKYELEYTRLVGMFQYLIGNTDWGITHSKNIKYVEKDQKVLPVPYDFDFAGLVDAPYLLMASRFGQTSRFDRVYLGFEQQENELGEAIEMLQAHKEDMYRTVQNMKMLKRSSREEMIAYLDTYFENAEGIRFTENWY
ncbi:hypothetical protein [Flavilitoribacter nigricans]|uniref:Uncharacterized protein n=1 Tax=Flavilitoribacter nigricans (strain ATCC 23147 / DSM 23189 / NBRC 102662 / NCIMB 1420 / SS-2) TaxID=1122177 RepID=A0A2D0NEQ4_FLAN2|nr:hypothetical protein [Flavilitoribacter nigricans]PHN06263.1 hypothetical protein CRP01_11855 [Flavilitoribacter nigricans DSM 23189 = NBRC 102662]